MLVLVIQEEAPTPYDVLVGSLPQHAHWSEEEEEEGARCPLSKKVLHVIYVVEAVRGTVLFSY